MGIGLSIVRGIADKHGAELEFIRLPKGGICSRVVIDKRNVSPTTRWFVLWMTMRMHDLLLRFSEHDGSGNQRV
ncbi:MAG: hypothetical protein ACLRW2_08820 [Parasutterella excrementihominis]